MASQRILTTEENSAALDAAISVLALTVDPAWRAEVLFHMEVIAAAALRVLEFPLDETVESASVFAP